MDPEKAAEPRRHKLRGRMPGVRNKATSTVKDAFQRAFDLLGGPEGLARWASEKRKDKTGHVYRPNLAAFYELAAKLIPTESMASGHISHGHYVARTIDVESREALPAPAPVHVAMSQQGTEDAVLVENTVPDFL